MSKLMLHARLIICIMIFFIVAIFFSEFGFIHKSFTAVESYNAYNVELAFLSGRAPFGQFTIFLQYIAGSASMLLICIMKLCEKFLRSFQLCKGVEITKLLLTPFYSPLY